MYIHACTSSKYIEHLYSPGSEPWELKLECHSPYFCGAHGCERGEDMFRGLWLNGNTEENISSDSQGRLHETDESQAVWKFCTPSTIRKKEKTKIAGGENEAGKS